ncbi:MAG TPA: hypothetical protein VMU05_13125 [Dongiaceae bacterium]|nr:hypothetical protein [Dongiaceae bacterium]
MTGPRRRILFWTPRILAMLYIAFLSMFALDVFSEEHGFWRIVAALSIHLIPTFILTVVLILAWRWEWIGAALYAAAGVVYTAWVLGHPLAPAIKVNWILIIGTPTLLIAALFLANWLKHDELHPKP